MRTPEWIPLFALAACLGACDKGKEPRPACDQEALRKLAGSLAERRASLEEQKAERTRLVEGVKSACPTGPKWLFTYLDNTLVTDADGRAEILSGTDFEALREQSDPIRSKVCPNHEAVFEKMAAADGDARADIYWNECKLERLGLYERNDPEGGREPGSLMTDFMLFQYLLDNGTPKDTARAVARGLGVDAHLERDLPESGTLAE